MSEVTRMIRVDGWMLAVRDGDGDPLIQDIELGTRLGYARPRKIRDLIERLLREGKLNDSDVCPIVGRSKVGFAQHEVTEYWMPEATALYVVSRAETDTAVAMTKEMIRVFIAARKGMLPPVAPATESVIFTQLRADNAALAAQFAALAARVETLSLDHTQKFPQADLSKHPEQLRECRNLLMQVARAEGRVYNKKPCISAPHARLCIQYGLRTYRHLQWPKWEEARNLMIGWIAKPVYPERPVPVDDSGVLPLFPDMDKPKSARKRKRGA